MIESVDFENRENGVDLAYETRIQLTKNPSELFNTLSHLIGGILSIIGFVILLKRTQSDIILQLICIIYGGSNILLFLASSVCHSQKQHAEHQTIWSVFDQAAIYLMIAGTYTPVIYLTLPKAWFIGLLIGQWSFALIGILMKFIKIGSAKWITAVIYLIQGWMLIPAIPILIKSIALSQLIMIFGGGLWYSIGTIFYMTGKPKLFPGKFGAHELWHIFVLFGASCFYMVVYQLV